MVSLINCQTDRPNGRRGVIKILIGKRDIFLEIMKTRYCPFMILFHRKQGSKQTRRKGAASRIGECAHNRKCSEPLEKARLTRRQQRKAGGRVEENDDWTISGRRKQFSKRKMSEIVQEDLSPSSDHSHEKITDFDSDISNENYNKSTNSKNKFYSRG